MIRRTALKHIGTFVGIAAFSSATTTARAQSKLEKSAVKYQDKANDGKDCVGCLHFMAGATPAAPGTCKVVAGDVAASGFCLAFTKKPAAKAP